MLISWIHCTRLVSERFVWVLWFVIRIMAMLNISEYLCEVRETISGQNAYIVNEACYSSCSEASAVCQSPSAIVDKRPHLRSTTESKQEYLVTNLPIGRNITVSFSHCFPEA